MFRIMFARNSLRDEDGQAQRMRRPSKMKQLGSNRVLGTLGSSTQLFALS
jgi:hypothetical protein